MLSFLQKCQKYFFGILLDVLINSLSYQRSRLFYLLLQPDFHVGAIFQDALADTLHQDEAGDHLSFVFGFATFNDVVICAHVHVDVVEMQQFDHQLSSSLDSLLLNILDDDIFFFLFEVNPLFDFL